MQGPVVEMRGGGGGGQGVKPPKCARKCANFRNLKANVQILDRKTPPQMVYPISPTGKDPTQTSFISAVMCLYF